MENNTDHNHTLLHSQNIGSVSICEGCNEINFLLKETSMFMPFSDFKILAKEIKTKLSVGGSFKDDKIIIQGDFRDTIMKMLKDKGFKVKRVGG